MTPINCPPEGKACPPQFSPDSIRNSETQSPRFARKRPWIAAERKSLTLRMIRFFSRPKASGRKSGNSLAYVYRRWFSPAENTTAESRVLRAKPRRAESASLNSGGNRMPSRNRTVSSFVMMLTSMEPGRICSRRTCCRRSFSSGSDSRTMSR